MNDAERYAHRKATITPATDGERPCTGCGETKPLTEFYAHPLGKDGRGSKCKPCERHRLQHRKHGMTARQKSEIAASQGGCAICGRLSPGGKGWVVDHDHACCPGESSCTKCRRGVLCQWCNSSLGYAFDKPELLRRMADYLESHLAGAIGGAIGTATADTYSTNGRTLRTHVDGGYSHLNHSGRIARNPENGPESDCICIAQLTECPPNCLIRWTREQISTPPPPAPRPEKRF